MTNDSIGYHLGKKKRKKKRYIFLMFVVLEVGKEKGKMWSPVIFEILAFWWKASNKEWRSYMGPRRKLVHKEKD